MSISSEIFTTVATDDTWMRGMHPGHVVELLVYGRTMVGRVTRIAPDNITVRIPIEEQAGDVRRFTASGSALISLESAAARVPVTAKATGEFVRLQFVGPAEIIQRRLHVRVPLSVPVKLAWLADNAWCWAESRTVDISVGGVRIASARAVWPGLGEQVQLSIDLPGGTVSERATVIGKTPDYDLRLAFVAVSQATRLTIEGLIR